MISPSFYDIFLAFCAEQTFFFGRSHVAAAFDKFVVGNGFCADEASFEVRMDFSGGLRRLGSASDGPGAAFIFSCG